MTPRRFDPHHDRSSPHTRRRGPLLDADLTAEHALLSGELARHWGAPPFALLEPRDVLLAAVDHHDDGWDLWERRPGVDGEQGRPTDFTEMPLDDSLAIWGRSIDGVERLGPLAAYVVAGHFVELLTGSLERRGQRGEPIAEAQQWAAEMDNRRGDWLSLWQDHDPVQHTFAAAQRALAMLQFFDYLSLWLCCEAREKPEQFEPPGGPPLTITPNQQQMTVVPWPFTTERLALEVPATTVPAAHYATPDDLASAEQRDVNLRWEITP